MTTTTFSVKVAAPALPATLQIPFLTESYLDTEFIETTVNSQYTFDDRYSNPTFDYDAGEDLNWCSNFSMEAMNASYDYQPTDLTDEYYEYQSPGNVKRFSRLMKGIRVDLTEPIELANGSYAYVDWMECIRYWRSEMTEEQIERIDWANLNPNQYVIGANASFELITN